MQITSAYGTGQVSYERNRRFARNRNKTTRPDNSRPIPFAEPGSRGGRVWEQRRSRLKRDHLNAGRRLLTSRIFIKAVLKR